MKIARLMAGVGVVAAGALVLSGCGNPYQSEVVEGTEITTAYNSGFFHFNDDSSAGNNTANGNVKYMTDTTFAYYNNTPELVRNTDFGEYEQVSEDPLTVKYTITADAVWSDGVPIDEADMLLQWAAMSGNVNDAFSPAASTGYSLVTETPETGDKEITFVYDEPYVDWELVGPLGVSAHGTYALAFPDEYSDVQAAYDTWKESGEEGDFTAYSDAAKDFAETAKEKVVTAITDGDEETLAALGDAWSNAYGYTTLPDSPAAALTSGPYIVDDIVEDQYISIAANPLFTWGPSPKFEKITIRTIADSTTALQALESGELDIWSGQPTADILQLANDIDTATVQTGVQASHEHVDLTVNNGGPFDPATYGGDEAKALAVRQAFLKTVPRQEIVDKIIKPLNPEAEVRNTNLVSQADVERYPILTESNGSADYAEVDIEGAKALLAEAGVTGPVEVGFWYPEGNVRRGQEYELIAASAALAGFQLVDESEPDWVFTDPAAEPINPHDATLFAWSQTSLAVGGSDQIYACYDDPMAKGGNYNGFCDEEVTDALHTLNVTSDYDAQTDLLEQAETGIWASATTLPIFQFPGLLVNSDKVTEVKEMPLSPDYFWNFWEWTPAGAGAE
ncbi:ABC transporter family substrate-binding protein [Microbacterium sp. CFH 31415]|uniref:ABC transporter family substrate-binding protein n=1 Tax=Microbacterium sp. CFH 31415 TaxID=2921732 RepID=UPI001F133B3E|nr:ABC transporter family substrate-binding protein [Microbacterium sp. CFH 31415]MCH6232177.1 ABC transporter family substrate-binding protein [Microbacterium sp. CFH 31415]